MELGGNISYSLCVSKHLVEIFLILSVSHDIWWKYFLFSLCLTTFGDVRVSSGIIGGVCKLVLLGEQWL